MTIDFAPLREKLPFQNPWEGNCKKKPWDYEVSACIPVLDTYEQVQICIDLLRNQTIPPFIIVIDTGSSDAKLNKILNLRNIDVEVHSLRFNGLLHPSDFPAIAMDLAFSMCRTNFLYATHADVFIKRKDFIEYLINLCKKESPVIGYEISPRAHDDWIGMVSHTATMYHMPTMDKIGFGWSLRRLCNTFDIKDSKPDPTRPCWPDTELLGNYILRKNKIKPYLIGKEQNFKRTYDQNIDHFRSFTSGKLYSDSYFSVANKWYKEAKYEALARIDEWQKS